MRRKIRDRFSSGIRDGVILRPVRRLRRVGHLSLEITGDHRQRAAGEIAETIGEVGVIALYERIKAERTILPKNNFAH